MAQTTEDALTTLQNAQNNAKAAELTKLATAKPAAVNTSADALSANLGTMTTQNRVNQINDMYDAQRQARMNELQSAYDLSRSEMQAQADKIAPQYQTQQNANAVDWERQRRNFLEGALVSGINTGAGSQAQLAMIGQQQRNMNDIRKSQAEAEAESGRQLSNLTAQYQASIQKAAADNDYQKAAALLDEYAKGYDRDLKNAQILAEFGDFSGYEGLYGEETAKNMSDFWARSNPDTAYILGKITADQRDNIVAGRPINDGLDENGKRIVPLYTGGGGGWSGPSPQQVLYTQYGQLAARAAAAPAGSAERAALTAQAASALYAGNKA